VGLGGRRSERDKGKNKEYRVRALPSARDDYVFDRDNKSHPRNQQKRQSPQGGCFLFVRLRDENENFLRWQEII